jgi:hypothetical protein
MVVLGVTGWEGNEESSGVAKVLDLGLGHGPTIIYKSKKSYHKWISSKKYLSKIPFREGVSQRPGRLRHS